MFKVGIIGLGFLGGSLAKSLRKTEIVSEIVALDKNEESLNQALNEGIINEYSLDVDNKFSNCDMVFICTPVGFIPEYAKRLDEIVKEDCIITDTGSTKRTILQESKNLVHEFIGGHPMVGSERSGYSTSKDFLFENSYFIITKNDRNKQESIDKITEIVKSINAIPIIIDEEKHDYVTAAISHVPHVVAATLVNMVKDLDDENETMKTLAAGGFKDITRIASSDPTMWENICLDNSENILKVLGNFKNIIEEFERNIHTAGSTYSFFDSSKTYRDSFINRKINGNTMPELSVSIKDENGAIAKVATVLSANNVSIKNIEVMNNRENMYGALRVVCENYEQRDCGFEVLNNMGFEVTKVN